MARRGGSPSRGSAMGRGRSPSPSATRRAAPPPARPQQKSVAPAPTAQVGQPAAAAASPGGGLMANVASTAAGVAIGHTIGHAITGAFMGGDKNEPAVADQQQLGEPMQGQHQHQSLAGQEQCKYELEQFLTCAKDSYDLTLCDGFNQVLKDCKMRYSEHQYR